MHPAAKVFEQVNRKLCASGTRRYNF